MTMNRDEIESAIRFVYREALDTDEDVATVGLSLEERIKAATVVLFTGNLDQLGGYELEESTQSDEFAENLDKRIDDLGGQRRVSA